MKLLGKRILAGRRLFRQALRGVAIGPEDQIAVVGDQEARVFAPNGKQLHRWPTRLAGRSVAFDRVGNMLVGQTGQIEQFDRTGRSILLVDDQPRLGRVTALALWAESAQMPECLLVADATGRCLRRYDARHAWLADLGADNNTHGFLIPNGRLDFCVARAGLGRPGGMGAGMEDSTDTATIFAANPAKHRLEQYTFEGNLIGHFGRFGHRPEDFSGCCNPISLTITAQGELVVAEKAPPRIKVFDLQGQLLAVANCELLDPNCKHLALASDRRGRILVADTQGMNLVRFEPERQANRRDSDAAHQQEQVPA